MRVCRVGGIHRAFIVDESVWLNPRRDDEGRHSVGTLVSPTPDDKRGLDYLTPKRLKSYDTLCLSDTPLKGILSSGMGTFTGGGT